MERRAPGPRWKARNIDEASCAAPKVVAPRQRDCVAERYAGGFYHVTGEGNRREIASQGLLRVGLGLVVVLLCQDVDDLVARGTGAVLLLFSVVSIGVVAAVSCYLLLSHYLELLQPLPLVTAGRYSPNAMERISLVKDVS